MNFQNPKEFSGEQAWDALHIADVEGATVRLHWTDQPYIWHENDGDEVFVVLDGSVIMHYRHDGQERQQLMNAGDICHASLGDEHVAHPQGVARILVIEKKGSV